MYYENTNKNTYNSEPELR